MEIVSINGRGLGPKVAVLMSGGVDSSVTAALLHERGFQVIGLTLKLWDSNGDEDLSRKVCCTAVMARDAGRVCNLLGISHYTLDLRDLFYREVIEPFKRAYLQGNTPNPCVRCNSRVKWAGIAEKMEALGIEYLATGHYARIIFDPYGNPHLLRGRDTNKDQSYFLWEVPLSLLKKTILPLGECYKSEVRRYARSLGLPVSDKEESQEVCFIPRNDYRQWLKTQDVSLQTGELEGEIVDTEGRVLARHRGYPFYTVGQRRGLGIGGGRRFYVVNIDPETRRVVVGDEEDLKSDRIFITAVNRLSSPLDPKAPLWVKVRYRDKGVSVKEMVNFEDGILLKLAQPTYALAPGQSAVIYQGEEVIMGGIIERDKVVFSNEHNN